MNPTGTVAKLEAILARIKSRAAEPRAPREDGHVAHAAPAPVAPPPAYVPPAPVVAAPAPVVAAPPPVATPQAPPVSARGEPATVPPQSDEAEAELSVDVDVTEVVPSVPPVAHAEDAFPTNSVESAERWVAAPAVASEPPRAPQPSAAAEDVDALLDASNAPSLPPAEEPPASSRRPVALEPERQLADMAFGADEEIPLPPPRHTPPPKSGRLPSPPIVEFESDVTGVREAAMPSPDDDHTQPSAQAATPAVLTPQAVRPNLAMSGGPIVDVVAAAAAFAPKTFAELLDASLGL